MDVLVFEIVSELFLFGFVPLVATVAAVWAFWNVLETIDPNEVKSIQSFLTVIVVIVPFAMLVFLRTGSRDVRSVGDCIG
jgi:hypothetical protein